MPPRRDTMTPDLFDWTPPAIVERFDERQIQAPTLRDRLARAVAAVLADCEIPREEIARQMTEWLGEDMSTAMLDKYASQASTQHVISANRLAALSKVTGDLRALQLLANEVGFVVVPKKYEAAINDAILTDQIDELTRQRAGERRRWKG